MPDNELLEKFKGEASIVGCFAAIVDHPRQAMLEEQQATAYALLGNQEPENASQASAYVEKFCLGYQTAVIRLRAPGEYDRVLTLLRELSEKHPTPEQLKEAAQQAGIAFLNPPDIT